MTTLLTLLFQWISLLSLISSTIVSAKPYDILRLRVRGGKILQDSRAKPQANTKNFEKDFKTFFYTQTLDHFNYRPESYATFKQRYVINSKYWGGAKKRAPIFVYFGAEAPLDDDSGVAFINENAPHFKALIVYIEHRYYGKSIPFGSMEEAMKNTTTRGYFNSAQAIADYAEVIIYLKKKFSAHHSPVIVFGGSYGGMLASWFRLKYPHIALGALASSAPILYFDDLTPQNGYYSIVTKNFKKASESCYQTIKKSWSKIDEVASQQNGLSILSQRFKTCSHLNSSRELKEYLEGIYCDAAQYNGPPTYPVTVVCRGIDRAPKGTDILGRIFAGVVAYKKNQSCYDTKKKPSESDVGYKWQECSEMVMPIGVVGRNDTMFQPNPFNLKNFTKECYKLYGVTPRPHWITTYYGGHDIKLVLRRFASNIIFSNGLTDPYSSGGILDDISDTIHAIYTTKGSHCLDIVGAKQSDPYWLVKQRKREIKIIEGWIKKYFADLSTMQKTI